MTNTAVTSKESSSNALLGIRAAWQPPDRLRSSPVGASLTGVSESHAIRGAQHRSVYGHTRGREHRSDAVLRLSSSIWKDSL